MTLRLIVNPQAGGGTAARCLPGVVRELKRRGIDHRVVESQARGHATALAREAIADGVSQLAVVGGDGSLNEVVQAYLGETGAIEAGPELGLLPAGTGGDLLRSFGEPSLDESLTRLLEGPARPIDLGVATFVGDDGRPARRLFVNVLSFGLGGLTDLFVEQAPRWLGGKAAYFVAAARSIVAFSNAPLRLEVDGEVWHEGPVTNVAVCNGRYFGGGMMVAPEADPSDGLFDIVVFSDMTKARAVSLSFSIYDGKHLARKDVLHTRGKVLEASPLGRPRDVLLDVDGEMPGKIPVRTEVMAGAVKIRL